MSVQTVLIPKKNHTLQQAKEQVKELGYEVKKVDNEPQKKYYRFRQMNPRICERKKCRFVKTGDALVLHAY